MDAASFIVQALNGLAAASSLFLVAAGLSLIFGVSRIVNFAHGSFFMLGVYVAYSLVSHLAPSVSIDLTRHLNGQPMSMGIVTNDDRWMFRFRIFHERQAKME